MSLGYTCPAFPFEARRLHWDTLEILYPLLSIKNSLSQIKLTNIRFMSRALQISGKICGSSLRHLSLSLTVTRSEIQERLLKGGIPKTVTDCWKEHPC